MRACVAWWCRWWLIGLHQLDFRHGATLATATRVPDDVVIEFFAPRRVDRVPGYDFEEHVWSFYWLSRFSIS